MKKNPSICPSCGKSFECGLLAGKEKCWCQDLELLISLKKDTSCLCPDCLKQALAIRESQS